MTGVVTKIIRKEETRTMDKGGYFFVRDNDGFDRFAHARDLIGISFAQLTENALVEFTPIEGGQRGNGRRAEKVSPVGA
jgi:cold shock CspA family protein